MGMLHLVASAGALGSCLDRLGAEDVLLLVEEGVHAARDPLLADLPQAVHVLEDELAVRGLSGMAVQPGIRRIGYDGFVGLTAGYHPVVTWR